MPHDIKWKIAAAMHQRSFQRSKVTPDSVILSLLFIFSVIVFLFLLILQVMLCGKEPEPRFGWLERGGVVASLERKTLCGPSHWVAKGGPGSTSRPKEQGQFQTHVGVFFFFWLLYRALPHGGPIIHDSARPPTLLGPWNCPGFSSMWACLISGELTDRMEPRTVLGGCRRGESWGRSAPANVAKSCKSGLLLPARQTQRSSPDDCTCMTFSCRLGELTLYDLVHWISTKRFSNCLQGAHALFFIQDSPFLQLDSLEAFYLLF